MATVTVREYAAGEIHLAEQPATKNVAILIGVSRHRQRADTKLTKRVLFAIKRSVNGLGVGHVRGPVKSKLKLAI
jgi:hypothetical protein